MNLVNQIHINIVIPIAAPTATSGIISCSPLSSDKVCYYHVRTHRVVGDSLLFVCLEVYPNFWERLFRRERNTFRTPLVIVKKIIILFSFEF